MKKLLGALLAPALLAPALIMVIALPVLSAPAQAQNLNEVFRRANPSVVVIRARGRDVSNVGVTRFSETGSGVLVSADGKVMTAAHVVNAMDEITVEALGGERVSAKIIASEPAADLSLLQLERMPPSMRAARMADSSTVRVGDQVIVIGAPYGLAHSMSAGWVSARWPPNTVYKSMPLAEFFQTTATINTGNSGGPMFNMAAEVIGIVSHNISKSGGSEGLGFVVTINTAKKLLLERKSFWTGIDGTMLTGDLAAIFNVPEPSGFLVKTVAQGSSGWDMGLLGGDKIATIAGQQIAVGGDIILSVDGIAVGSDDNIEKIRNRLAAEPPGTPFKMKVLRAGKVIELTGKTQQ
ncbi:MAG: trypsin-like peptidase domain-containing protein [Candidatus Rokubacteria bacterium]|nr:trypsin-like peptidase domain-containing protein [Candidatus Rokubacteria bacterium]